MKTRKSFRWATVPEMTRVLGPAQERWHDSEWRRVQYPEGLVEYWCEVTRKQAEEITDDLRCELPRSGESVIIAELPQEAMLSLANTSKTRTAYYVLKVS